MEAVVTTPQTNTERHLKTHLHTLNGVETNKQKFDDYLISLIKEAIKEPGTVSEEEAFIVFRDISKRTGAKVSVLEELYEDIVFGLKMKEEMKDNTNESVSLEEVMNFLRQR